MRVPREPRPTPGKLLELARLSGGSRSQVRSALRNLAMTGRIVSRPAATANRREIQLIAAA